jgi:hypothetical protein
MIVKQINRPKNSVSSFPRLFKYLTTELDPNTGARRKRCTKREIVWSDNNLSFLDTAAYLRRHLALRVRTLPLRNNATWADLHSLSADHYLCLERRKNCTYTIFNPQHNVRVKAADVFLHNFGGKHARHLTERQLGPWAEM